MKSTVHSILIALIILFFTSCNTNNNVACTTVYVSVVVTVHGGVLDKYFTIQNSTGDTIRYKTTSGKSDSLYGVLSDDYIHKFKHEVETFTFKGFVQDSLVINEQYLIKADQCHIYYLSGKTDIKL
ncbi:MAG: hypothetical protein JNJ85_16690 [Candidatus Kapabacteria bacterium]|nr:hypothetical protein [Candidatus Kapabacteria bacterium]MBX7154128.1 hypothetical protein [Bacteroidota bacterium]